MKEGIYKLNWVINFMKKENGFIFLEHMADIKFQAFGKTLEKAFENSALAFSSYISSGGKISSKRSKTIEIKAENNESLLYNFLDELIYLLDAEGFAVAAAKVQIKDNKLTAELKGDDIKNYHLNHVKAATYAEMHIKKSKSEWEVQAVLDV